MNQYVTEVFAIISVILGSSTVLTWLMYRKSEKRARTADAFGKEVQALESTIGALQKQVDWHEERLNKAQEQLISKDVYISQLSADKSTLEVKNSANKSAINRAHGCEFCDTTANCPVLKQRIANEEAYAEELRRKKHVDSNGK